MRRQPTAEQIKAAADRAEARGKASASAADEAAANDNAKAEEGFAWPETKGNGTPIKGSMMNVRKAIDALKLTTRYDVFLDKYTIEGPGLGSFVGEIDDIVVRKFRELCFKELDYEPGKDAAFDGIQRACEENRFNSLQDYLSPLRWDGTKRLDTWLTTYLGVEDTSLHSAWGRLVLMAAVRRAFDPGCKFDHVLSLEGPEGGNKSTACKVLACGKAADELPAYFSDSTILDKDEKQQMELTKGVWIYELSEAAGLNKADQKKVKAFVTRQEERARKAYARFPSKQPRIAVFISTVNPDPNTGEVIPYLNHGDRRRWWPVEVGVVSPIDIPALVRDRDQLFAEAMDRVQVHDGLTDEPTGRWNPLTLDPSLWAAAAEQQIEREIEDPLTDRLATLYSELTTRLKANEARMIDGKHAPTAGRDYIVADAGEAWGTTRAEVWVSAKFVTSILPPTMTQDSRRVPAALGNLGWKRVKDSRTGVEMRGYVHVIEKPDASAG